MASVVALPKSSYRKLLQSWSEIHLPSLHRSPKTIKSYVESADQLADFLERKGLPTDVEHITSRHVELFIAQVLATRKPATAGIRYRSLAQWFKWLLAEGEISENP